MPISTFHTYRYEWKVAIDQQKYNPEYKILPIVLGEEVKRQGFETSIPTEFNDCQCLYLGEQELPSNISDSIINTIFV